MQAAPICAISCSGFAGGAMSCLTQATSSPVLASSWLSSSLTMLASGELLRATWCYLYALPGRAGGCQHYQDPVTSSALQEYHSLNQQPWGQLLTSMLDHGGS